MILSVPFYPHVFLLSLSLSSLAARLLESDGRRSSRRLRRGSNVCWPDARPAARRGRPRQAGALCAAWGERGRTRALSQLLAAVAGGQICDAPPRFGYETDFN